MSSPYVGEIRMFGGNFAPAGWAFCNGQIMSISQNDVLFNLIGTTYGGDGVSTFALPNLQGRIPLHVGPGIVQGQLAGEENHTLITQEIPSHTHNLLGMGQATTTSVAANLYGGGGLKAYKAASGGTMNAAVVKANSGSQPHDNMMPFGVVSFIIALFGVFPSRS
jgi:microcystin-dependent protein